MLDQAPHGPAPRPGPADLVLRHGTIATMDAARPRAEALAIQGGRIIAVGSDDEIAPLIGRSTEVIELEGRLAVPGFIEGHGHFTGLGAARMQLDLRAARRWSDIVALVADAARQAAPEEWIRGRGWHQDHWDEAPEPSVAGLPLHHALSDAVPDHPVLLTHRAGHSALANAKAMALAGITRDTADPPGGQILRDARGEPTGAFLDAAVGLVGAPLRQHLEARRPHEIEAETRRQVELATKACLANGITTFHEAGSSLDTIGVYRKLADEGRLGVRLYVMMSESDERLVEALPEGRLVGYGGHRLTVRAVKRLIDGALGARTAWMFESYADRPESAGLCVTEPEAIEATARLCLERGLQLCVHAIGDRATRETLDLMERALRGRPDAADLRWRIEHAQHVHPDDVPRFAGLGVIAAMQGNHCTADGPFVAAALGERRAKETTCPWASLLRAGAVVVNGTDAPVEELSPLSSFYASVTRRLPDGTVFVPGERMTREQALRSYTVDAAWAAFEQDLKGSLTPGKLADIAVLSRNILAVPEDEIPGSEVVCTILGGRVAYEQ